MNHPSVVPLLQCCPHNSVSVLFGHFLLIVPDCFCLCTNYCVVKMGTFFVRSFRGTKQKQLHCLFRMETVSGVSSKCAEFRNNSIQCAPIMLTQPKGRSTPTIHHVILSRDNVMPGQGEPRGGSASGGGGPPRHLHDSIRPSRLRRTRPINVKLTQAERILYNC